MSSDVEPMGGKVLAGSIWMIGLRWSMRLLGFVSTIILARLLTPDDFGLVAMSVLATGFVLALTEAGSAQALIRHPDPQRVHYDTAWTINVMLGLVAGLVIVMMAPLAALYFDDGRITGVLLVTALSTAIAGFSNIGTADFRRDFRFGRQFWLQFWPRIAGFAVTVALAIVWRSYWALILGWLAGAVAQLVASYVMHPYRPRFSLGARAEMLAFSIHASLSSLAWFLEQRLDQIVLGGIVRPAMLGLYYLASNLAEMATRELVAPLGPVVYSAYSRIHADGERMIGAVRKSVGAAALLGFGSSLGLYVVAREFILAIYGPQWAGGVMLLEILALSALGACIRTVTLPLLTAQGRQRATNIASWSQVAGLAVLLPLAFRFAGGEGVAGVRAVMEIVAAGVSMILAFAPYKGLLGGVLRSFARPLLAGAAMVAVVRASQSLLPLDPVPSLALNVPLGALVYVVVVLLLWRLAGRPDGAESGILEQLADAGRALARRRRRGEGK
ncbi:lipopolysaccharide biosynthesis protein [Emcibacter sp. SYSU 3D8]|uniref:lipopolysaccharide biosynthesis protein n=1 Tax=Emcibacter sp. SYSU 3D8 TaxID=3133969 RepID=UPI0031FE7FF4